MIERIVHLKQSCAEVLFTVKCYVIVYISSANTLRY